MRRQQSMAFAPGMYVFPGGGVDAADTGADIAWVGAPVREWAERLRCDESTARGLVCAAVRETFEESGVLLAGPDEHSIVIDATAPEFLAARGALEARELSFADFLHRFDLVLRADLLAAWSHWITPDFEPRRFDTRFFVATLPEGQSVGELPGEADRASWMPVGEALKSLEAGAISMLRPTSHTLREVLDVDLADILTVAATRPIAPIEPQLVEVEGKAYLETHFPGGGDV